MDSAVTVLNKKNFKKKVFKSKELWMVKFYSPWCPPCQTLSSKWIRAAKILKGKVNFGEVDCTKEFKLVNKYKIRRLPTIKFFYKSKENTMTYIGERKSSSIIKYAIKKKKNNGLPLKNNNN